MNQAIVRFPQFQLPHYAPAAAQWTLKLLTRLTKGRLEVITPEGVHLMFGEEESPSAQIHLKTWNVCSSALKSGDIGFAESYIAGEWETSDLTALLGVFVENRKAVEQVIYGSTLGGLAYKIKHWFNRNTKGKPEKTYMPTMTWAIPFYQLWLDPSMTYSSALFEDNPTLDLEQGQATKYQALLNFLNPQKGNRILEIGCGWGGFAEKACAMGAQVLGLTLSDEQLVYAQNRLEQSGLGPQAEFRLQDYRDCKSTFDHIASIEMFEAVGEPTGRLILSLCIDFLNPKGKAAIQTIVIAEELFDRYRKSTDFIQQYIFPGGMLPSRSKFVDMAQKHGLRVVNEKRFGKDYAQTLKQWQKSFIEQTDVVRQLGFDDAFVRTWHFYLAYCEAGFEYQNTDVIQFYLEKD